MAKVLITKQGAGYLGTPLAPPQGDDKIEKIVTVHNDSETAHTDLRDDIADLSERIGKAVVWQGLTPV